MCREINSTIQKPPFYNLSLIGCIVLSAKATACHMIRIKGSQKMPLTTMLAIKGGFLSLRILLAGLKERNLQAAP